MKRIVRLIKIYPIVVTLVISIGLMLCIAGINISNITYPIFGHSIFANLIMMIISIKLRFCRWHQILIGNLLLIISIEWLSVNVGFIPDAMAYITIISATTSTSILMSSILYYKHGCFKTTARKGHRNAR